MFVAVIILSFLVVLLASALIFVFLKYVRKPKEKEEKKETPVESKAEVRIEPKKEEIEEKSDIERRMNIDDPFDQKKRENGKLGERLVDDSLEKLIEGKNGYLMTNFCFENENGYSSEIDAILVCEGGIFVIETKNINGSICGKREQPEWNSFRHDAYEKPVPFRNPIDQNRRHIRNLENLFIGNHPKMISMVIFLSGDISRVRYPEVKSLAEAIDYIQKAIESKKYTKDFIDRTYRKLVVIKDRYGIDKERHLENILRQRDEWYETR